MWERLKYTILILVLVIVGGTFGFWILEDHVTSLLDSFFFTLVTVTTVGYGDITPQTIAGKILAIAVILLGVGAALSAIQTVFGTIVRKRIREELNLPEKIIEKSNHAIVCGFGMVGKAVVRNLQQSKKSYIVIENNNSRVEAMVELNIPVIEGDAREESVLERANIKTANSLFATFDDSSNVFVALTAKILNPQLKVVCKVEDLTNEPKMRKAGADEVIACHDVGARMMIQAAETK
ncbi:MAG: potassium channel family protein [Calditrichaeota bacterium]|nr:potassium channel family protein [Calditrichota bacterium]